MIKAKAFLDRIIMIDASPALERNFCVDGLHVLVVSDPTFKFESWVLVTSCNSECERQAVCKEVDYSEVVVEKFRAKLGADPGPRERLDQATTEYFRSTVLGQDRPISLFDRYDDWDD